MKKQSLNGLPEAQGLYNPAMEHDACGIGFIADIKGKKSHAILEDALTILKRLDHRGARGADEDTGDGAGIMAQIPHEYFSRECQVLGFDLPEEGEYAVGMVFMHRYDSFRQVQTEMLNAIVKIIDKLINVFMMFNDFRFNNDAIREYVFEFLPTDGNQ